MACPGSRPTTPRSPPPRARRNSEEVPALPGDTGLHRLYESSVDRDRHTEVGGPPTGQIPKDAEPLPSSSESTGAAAVARRTTGSRKAPGTETMAAIAAGSSRRLGWIIAAVVVVGGGGAALYAVTRPSAPRDPVVVAPPPADAAVVAPPTTGTVEIVTTPPGATGTIQGVAFKNPTPVHIGTVPAGKAKIHLELAGYLPIDYELDVIAGQVIVDRQMFVVAPAGLHVVTEPAGATVSLAGRNLGVTPLTRTDLAADKAATVVLSRAGFEPVTVKLELVAGKTAELERTLKPAQRFGTVQIQMAGGWGYVFAGGKKLGRAPIRELKLPVGKVALHLVNDGDKSKPPIEWNATCDVTETGPNVCVIKMP